MKLRNQIRLGIFFAFLIVASVGVVMNWGWVFARHVEGEVVGVERVTQPGAIISTGAPLPAEQIFSFAVAVKDTKTGEIVTASSTDRQWAVVSKGLCARVRYSPYPPWDLEKAGTYYNARLIKLSECKDGMVVDTPHTGEAGKVEPSTPSAPASQPSK